MTMTRGASKAAVAATALLVLGGPAGSPASAAQASTAGGVATVMSLSCPSAGNCVAGGFFQDGASRNHGFLLSERNGRWGTAIAVPGLVALTERESSVTSVSCASAGNCAVGGDFLGGGFHPHAFVVSERNGRWHKAIELPRQVHTRFTAFTSVSCGAPGNCVAAGGGSPFVFDEVSGHWGGAIAFDDANSPFTTNSVSCASPGNCVAGGHDVKEPASQAAFVVSERNGRWNGDIAIPGLAVLNKAGFADVASVSCASAGNCAAGGTYEDGAVRTQPFVVSEKNGHWSSAIEVPGIAALNTAGLATLGSVSCASAGNCAAGGSYATGTRECGGSGICQAFVVSEKKGHWGKAIEVPGLAARNLGGFALVESVSCASAGNCAAGGLYSPETGGPQAGFVVSEKNGHWRKALEVPGLAALDTARNSNVNAVSCASVGACAAGGMYEANPGDCPASPTCPAFVVSEKNGRWGLAQRVRF